MFAVWKSEQQTALRRIIMALRMATNPPPDQQITEEDQKWGYQFGVDGVWKNKRAREFADVSYTTLWD